MTIIYNTYFKEISKTDFISVSTTSRDNVDIVYQPIKQIGEKKLYGVLVNNEIQALEVLKEIDGKVETLLIDIENKKNFNLWGIAKKTISISNVFTIKPNDLTIEATDLFIRRGFSDDLTDLDIIVVGNGNLAFKTALRLYERGANVSIVGRNIEKVKLLTNTIKEISNRYNDNKIIPYNIEGIKNIRLKFNLLISYVSKTSLVDEGFINLLNSESMVVDGGIGNLSKKFLEKAHKKDIKCYRLDSRIASSYIGMYWDYNMKNFFNEVIGEREIESYKMVAGGILANEGDVVVDNISTPKMFIGLADGIGGIKNEKSYSKYEREKSSEAKKWIFEKTKVDGHLY